MLTHNLLFSVFTVMNSHLFFGGIDGEIQGVRKRGAFLHQMVFQEPELGALRKDNGLRGFGTILEMKNEMARYVSAMRGLEEVSIGQNLAVECPKREEAVGQAFHQAHAHRLFRSGTGGQRQRQYREQSNPDVPEWQRHSFILRESVTATLPTFDQSYECYLFCAFLRFPGCSKVDSSGNQIPPAESCNCEQPGKRRKAQKR